LKRRRLLLFLWLLVIAVAAMIFWFSSQDGMQSSQTSGGFTAFLLRLLYPGFDAMPVHEKAALFVRSQYFVRKAAHFTEFAMLGASARLLFHGLRLRRTGLWAWTAGTLYACTDELHQMFVSARAAMIQDVALDSFGVLAGAAAAWLFLLLRARIKRCVHKKAGR
jgi:VanZ family protein